MQKEAKKLTTIIIVIAIIAILILLIGYLLYTYYSDKPVGGGSTGVNETNTTPPSVNETPTPPTTKQTTNITKTTTTTTTNTSTTTTTGRGSNNGGGGGTTTPACTDTCTSLGYDCGNFTICGSLKNCGTCESGETCVDGVCSGAGGPYCGDTICIGTENCTNCPQDCGCAPGEICNEGECVEPGVCGNGLLEAGELCDSGSDNGEVGYCNTDCDGLVGNYYVSQLDSSCEDSGLGTSEEPWCSIDIIIDKIKNSEISGSDVVIFRNGDYGNFSLHSDRWNGSDFVIQGLKIYNGDVNEMLPLSTERITLKSDIDNNPVLDFIHIGSVHGPYQADLIFDGFIINSTEEEYPGKTSVYFEEVVGARIYNCEIIGNYGYEGSGTPAGIRINGCNDIKIINNSISKNRYGIIPGGYNIDIIGNKITDIGEDPLRMGGKNILVENNEMYSFGSNVPTVAHQDFIHFTNSENATFRNNRIYAHGGGSHFNGAGHEFKNFIFEGNIIYDMSGYELEPNRVINGVFRNNTIIGIGEMPGVRFGNDCSNINVSNNLFLDMYSGNDSTMNYHDKNIYVSTLDSSPGEREPNSYGYQSTGPTKYGIIQKLINETLTNYPEYCHGIIYNEKEINEVILGNDSEGYVTISKPGISFNEFNLRKHLDHIEFVKEGGLHCNSWSDPCKIRIKKAESNTITVYQKYDSLVLNKAKTYNMTVRYSASTKNKIYVKDTFGHSVAETYHIGDIIEYNYQETPHEITSIATDERGTYIQFTPDLPEKAFSERWFCNWGQGATNLKRDFRPKTEGPACNGTINPVGVAVGALPCVCTQDNQCVEVYGSGSTCNLITKECERGLESQSVQKSSIFSIVWNWIKSLLK